MDAKTTPSWDEFKNALLKNSFPECKLDVYKQFVASGSFVRGVMAKSFISSKQEMAMFVAQVFHESGGLQHMREINPGPDAYPNTPGIGVEGKHYYGRGFIQLTWDYNYEQCSKGLYGDRRLLNDPDLVSNSVTEAWRTAFWFWCENVHGHTNTFDDTTERINGVVDTGDQRAHRRQIYQNVCNAFGLKPE